MIKKRSVLVVLGILIGVMLAQGVFGSSDGGGHGAFAITFLWISIVLIAAKFSSLVEKFGQPAVLGELTIGVILGNLALFGITVLEPIKHDNIIAFLAELGVIILLFQIGLESNINEMKKVGLKAGIVAIIGVVVPFVIGTWFVGPWLLPGMSQNAYLFLGAALTATSVGITARVFKDLGKLRISEAKIVLGSAVIDDVLGLIILAVVSAMVTAGSVSMESIGLILGKAVLFLVGSILLGQLIAPGMGRILPKVQAGTGMKFTLAICFGLLFAYVAQLIGLAGIVGAFAAGLVLDPVHFRYFKDPKIIREIRAKFKDHGPETKRLLGNIINKHSHRQIEDLIEPIAHFFVPIFFVFTGMAVNLETMFDSSILLVALAVTVIAILGKLVAGLGAFGENKWLVGWGMVPRGEVGLIFATIGLGLGVVNDQLFSVIVIMVILTTLIPPPILGWLLKRQYKD